MAEAQSVLKALEKSLDFERRGSEFYLRLAIDTEQDLAKNLFYSLAKQEIDHMIRIEEILDALKRDTPWPAVPSGKMDEIEVQMKEIFDKLDEKRRGEELDNIKGYQLAIDMEREGYHMYKEFSENAVHEKEKQFFLALIEEEKSHLHALDNVYYFLTQSRDWFSAEETKVWNWMTS